MSRRKNIHLLDRRATDHPPVSEMVSKGNLFDRLEVVRERMDGHWTLDDERWRAHQAVHEAVAESLRDYKRDANEWRATLSDLRSSFLPKGEFNSEHRALDAKLHGEFQQLLGKVEALDSAIDTLKSDVKDVHTEQQARRSVFSDSRNVIATIGIVIGVIVSGLLIIDRLQAT